jgi:hypothetical protein
MTAFLAKLGEKLAERWVTLLVLPGALFVGVVAVATVLGHRNALAVAELLRRVQVVNTSLAAQPASAVLAAVGVLLAAVGAGLVARALGSMLERLWVIRSPAWLTAPLVRLRGWRWSRAQKACSEATVREGESLAAFDRRRGALAAARNRIALVIPSCPTWIGDRVTAADVRVYHEYGLDLTSAWPRLWLLATETARTAVQEARSAFADSAALTGWGLMYVAVGVGMWWPAVVIGLAVLVVGHGRGREAAGTFADLSESVVDLHCVDLAKALQVPLVEDRVTPQVGQVISERMRKGT